MDSGLASSARGPAGQQAGQRLGRRKARGPRAPRVATPSASAGDGAPRPSAPVASTVAVAAVASSAPAARAARRIRRSSDCEPGFARVMRAAGPEYRDCEGRVIRDEDVIARLNALAIPPAYTDVWICADPDGHLQATGRDARGRKQYRYHPLWRAQRDGDKFDRLREVARALPRVRAAVEHDLEVEGLPVRKVTAAIVRLLDRTFVRIGGDAYARENATYGLTTLRKRHVSGSGQRLTLRFKGKHGIGHEVRIDDPHAAQVIGACLRMPGRSLFCCPEDGETRRIVADDVNRYLHEVSRGAMTAKDFRTWAASVAALAALRKIEPPAGRRGAQRIVNAALREVAALLRNTPAVCRNSYVHPAVIEAFHAGTLAALAPCGGLRGLGAEERRLAALLGCATAAR